MHGSYSHGRQSQECGCERGWCPMVLTLMAAMMSRNALASGLSLYLNPNRTLARSG